jgi:hypothetical protein
MSNHNGTATETRLVASRKNHATVHTATVDVKIMRLAKKQVTMSVFRQLDEKSIFRRDKWKPQLRGTPRGRVNYTWKENPGWARYHIVWQWDDQLFRMGLPLPHHVKRHDSFWGQGGGNVANLWTECQREHDEKEKAETDAEWAKRNREYKDELKEYCAKYNAWAKKNGKEQISARALESDSMSEIDSVLEGEAPEIGYPPRPPEEWDVVPSTPVKIIESFELYVAQLEIFEQLDQLFIAV